MRLTTSFAVATAAAVLLTATPAVAHVTVAPAEAPADGYATLQLQVPHGCEGSATEAVRVRIPESVPSVTPQVHPGWEVTTKEGPKDAVELHGETVRRGIQEIEWTAADAGPLPDGRLDLFGLSVKLPAGAAGDPVYFPTVQRCVEGEAAWIQIPRGGETADDLESPAPAVTLTDARAEDGAAAPVAASVVADDAGPSTGLVIAALVLGALGTLIGLAALISGRRRGA